MDKKEFTVSEVIDSIGISSHTWVVFVLLAFAMIFDGYDFMIINSTNLFVAHTFWPDNPNPGALMGSLTTWGLLGMVLGGAVGGVISDRIGRKKTLVVAVMFYGLFTLPQAFANDIVFFAVFRLIAGFGVGSCIPVVTTVFSESMPSKQRGRVRHVRHGFHGGRLGSGRPWWPTPSATRPRPSFRACATR